MDRVRQLSPASESASPVPGEKPTDWVQKDCGTWMKSGGVRVAMLGDVVGASLPKLQLVVLIWGRRRM